MVPSPNCQTCGAGHGAAEGSTAFKLQGAAETPEVLGLIPEGDVEQIPPRSVHALSQTRANCLQCKRADLD